MKNHFVSAVITSAGNSTRMGTDKIFLQLNGKPAISYTLNAFEKAKTVDEIIVVCKDEHRNQIENVVKRYNINKFAGFAMGGATRQNSVFAGITRCDKKATHYAIHDAARCLITSEEIDSVILDAFTHKASTLGVPCKDTIKVINSENFVVRTPDRSTLWAIQTPQVFEKELYLAAMEVAQRYGKDYTDDCQLVEHMGKIVHVVRGNYSNFKLTTPDDVSVFKNILKLRIDKL